MKKILITGGHVTPAAAVIQELRKRNWGISYVGRQHALEGDISISQEMTVIKKMDVDFIPITTGRLQRNLSLHTLTSLAKIPKGIHQAVQCIKKVNPDVILSFGSYVAVPICIVAWVKNIPIVTHEQTLSPGLANKFIGKMAKKVCISWLSVKKHFPVTKVVYTGNPLRKEIFTQGKKLMKQPHKPLIYVTGGNLGAHSINIVMEKALYELLNKFTVIHQCGSATKYKDYERLCSLKERLPENLKTRYHVYQYIDTDYIGWVLNQTDIIVSRSGANIVSEILALKKPALFIPLPWSAKHEQLANARLLTENKAAEMILQKDLTPESLISELEQMSDQTSIIKANLEKMGDMIVLDADKKVVDAIESLV